MPPLPRVTAADLLRAPRRDGWAIDRQRGSHAQLVHSTRPGLVTIPVHAGRIVPPGTLLRILEQAGLTVDELRGLL